MRQIFSAPSEILVEEVPRPTCLPGGVLVRNEFSLISAGTETAGMQASHNGVVQNLTRKGKNVLSLGGKTITKLRSEGIRRTIFAISNRYPNLDALGYSSAGIVEEVGEGVPGFAAGDRVACAGSGYANHAEIVWVPVNLVTHLPENVSTQEAAYVALGAIAMQGIRRAEASLGENVLVIGLGLIGLLGVQIARSAGLRIIGFDPDRRRAKLATEFGASETFTDMDKLDRALTRLTSGRGFDAVILFAATRSSDPLDLAMKCSRVRGRVVVVGDVGLSVKRELMYRKELDLVMATSYGPGRYDPEYEERGHDYPFAQVRWTEKRNMEGFLALVGEGKVNVSDLTAATVDIADAKRAYSLVRRKEKAKPGVLIRYGPPPENEILRHTMATVHAKTKPSGSIGVAVLGAGGFAQSTHIPNLLKNKEYSLVAVLNTSGSKAKAVAVKAGAAHAATDLGELLTLPEIDAVIVCTRHHLHAENAVACLRVRKHVLLEKPLALDSSEVEAISKEAAASGTVFTVGFNRRYSRIAAEIRNFLVESRLPAFIQYRVNAGYISSDHWTQQPSAGGGRVIGEMCHFIDLCNYLVGERPIGVKAACIPPDGKGRLVRDNVSSILEYANGSLATIVYTSLGSPALAKERVEVYCGGVAAVLDDWKELEWYGDDRAGLRLKDQDKGLQSELVEFAKAIRGQPNRLLTIDDAIATTRVTFEIERQLSSERLRTG